MTKKWAIIFAAKNKNKKGHNVSFDEKVKVVEIPNENKGRTITRSRSKAKFVKHSLDSNTNNFDDDETPLIKVTDTEGNDHILD